MTEHEHGEKVLKIKIPRLNFWKVSTIVLAIFLIASVYSGGFRTAGDVADVPDEQPEVPKPTVFKDIDIEGDPVKGDENAELYLIEFSDYECPFCGRFVTDTLPEIEENYIDTGKVKHVFKDFPLGFHADAHLAAEAAECADDEGKFWEYHDLLFENQDALDEESLKGYAEELELDDFDECLADGTHEKEVDEDMADGRQKGLTGTPSFLVGNDEVGYVKIVGAQPYGVFEAAFDDVLA
jgi:protein-disulfide isomerase